MAWRCFSVNSCELTVSVTALAAGRSEEELSLLAAALTQLGDTLATIAVQRGICGKKMNQRRLAAAVDNPVPP